MRHLLQEAKTQEYDSTEYLSQLAGHYITLKSLLAVQDLHVDSLQGTAFLDLSSTASQQQHRDLHSILPYRRFIIIFCNAGAAAVVMHMLPDGFHSVPNNSVLGYH